MPFPQFLAVARWAVEHANGNGPATGFTSPASPAIGNALADAISGDVFGVEQDDPTQPVSRDMAMRQPAVVRCRGILVTLARYPLVAWRGERRLVTQPAWLHRTDTTQSPQERMNDSMDDVYFHSRSLWLLQRKDGIFNEAAGEITDAVRMPMDTWRDEPDGTVSISLREGHWLKLTNPKAYIRFRGFQDGFLKIGCTVVRTSDGIQRAISGRAKSPIPMIDLHLTENTVLTADEKEALRSAWVRARNSPEGAVAITPYNIEANVLGQDGSEFLDNARNSQRIDTANMSQVPAALIDGTTSTASLTYSTQEGRRVELNDYGLNLWRTVFEARLSQDDVTPRGTRIEIDLSELAQVPDEGNGPTLED